MYRVPILSLRTYQYTYIHFFPTFWFFMYVCSYQRFCIGAFVLIFSFFLFFNLKFNIYLFQ